jgi:hypothetical protein
MAATAATGGILDEAEFVELQEMLDKLLLIKYTDVLARQGLGLSALLELHRTGEAEKRLQRCGIFKGPRDAIVAELRARHMTGRGSPKKPEASAAATGTLAELRPPPTDRLRLWPGAAGPAALPPTAQGINGPTLERRRRATAPHLGRPDMLALRAGSGGGGAPRSVEPSAMGKLVSVVRNVVDGTSGPDADGGDAFFKGDGSLRESTPGRSGGLLSGGAGTTRFTEDSPLWAPPRSEPTGEDLLERLFKPSSDRQSELAARDKAAVSKALAVMAAKATQHRPTVAAGGGADAASPQKSLPLTQGVVVDADAAEICYMGRFDRRLGNAVRFDWPGSSISIRFRGSSSIAMRLAGAGNFYSVTIDDCMTATIFADDESEKDPVLHKIADGLAIRYAGTSSSSSSSSSDGGGGAGVEGLGAARAVGGQSDKQPQLAVHAEVDEEEEEEEDEDDDDDDDGDDDDDDTDDDDEEEEDDDDGDDELVVHTLRIVKRTEAIGSSFLITRDASARAATFRGFLLDPGAEILPPLPNQASDGTEMSLLTSDRKILFLGDEETAGFGNESTAGRLVPDPTNSNAGLAFAAVCAKLLSAQHHNIAWSGKGVVHNAGDFSCWNGQSDRPLPFYLDRCCASSSEPRWDYRQWQPQAVVVLLGGNDFVTARRPSLESFAAGYDELLRTLRHQYPSAFIFACSCESNLLPLPQQGERRRVAEADLKIDEVVASLKKDGDSRIVRQKLRLNGVELSPVENYFGAMGHWNSEIHTAVAVELAMEMRWRLQWDVGSETAAAAAAGGAGAGAESEGSSLASASASASPAESVPASW